MNRIDEVEKKIKKILQQVVNDANTGTEAGIDKDKWWTTRIKDALCQLGHNLKCVVSANGCDCADEKEEWLFDMVWSFPIDNWNKIKLAMECEWSLDKWEIWRDFEKLLVVRAQYRVYIFNQYNNDKVNEMMEKFKESISKFEGTQHGDRYLLAGYSLREANFVFEHYLKSLLSGTLIE
jgi:hypothetical protein